MTVGLLEGFSADTLSLAYVDIWIRWRVVAAGTANGGLVGVQDDDDERGGSAGVPRFPK